MLARQDYHKVLFNGQPERMIQAIKEGNVINSNPVLFKDIPEDAIYIINSFLSDGAALEMVNKYLYMTVRIKGMTNEEFQQNVFPLINAEISRELLEKNNLQDSHTQALVLVNDLDKYMKKRCCYRVRVDDSCAYVFIVPLVVSVVLIYFIIDLISRESNIENSLRYDNQPLLDNLSCVDFYNNSLILDRGCDFPRHGIMIEACKVLCEVLSHTYNGIVGLGLSTATCGLLVLAFLRCFVDDVSCFSRADAQLPDNYLDLVKKFITNHRSLANLCASQVKDELDKFVSFKFSEIENKEKSIAAKKTVCTMIQNHFGLFSLPQVPVEKREFHQIDIAESKEDDISSLRQPLLSTPRGGYGSINL